MTNRIGGPGPSEPSRGRGGQPEPDSDRFKEKMKKVEKVEEVEETELDKQKKRSFYQEPEEKPESESTRAPTPYEKDFSRPAFFRSTKPKDSIEDFSLSAIPTPDKSAPPQADAPVEKVESDSNDDLPQSETFWSDYDLADQPPPKTSFEENQPPGTRMRSEEELRSKNEPASSKESQKKRESPLEAYKKAKEEEAHFHKEKKKKHDQHQLHIREEKEKKTDAKEVAFQKEDEEREKKPTFVPPSVKKEEKSAPPAAFGLSREEKKKEQQAPMPSKKEPFSSKEPYIETKKKSEKEESLLPLEKHLTHEKREEGEKRSKNDLVQSLVIPDPLPTPIQQTLQTLPVPPPSYISAQTAAIEGLFRQMVGTILFVAPTTPGVSRTEVILNSSSMHNSPFFNSKILIEKYASAPDSFNIRLTGTPQAVRVFNDNLATLTAAFNTAYEQKRIPFRIGRLETSLIQERHMIRRKDSQEAEDEDSGDLQR